MKHCTFQRAKKSRNTFCENELLGNTVHWTDPFSTPHNLIVIYVKWIWLSWEKPLTWVTPCFRFDAHTPRVETGSLFPYSRDHPLVDSACCGSFCSWWARASPGLGSLSSLWLSAGGLGGRCARGQQRRSEEMVKKAACTRSIRPLSDWTPSLCPRRPSARTSGTPSDWGKEARQTAAAPRRSARGSAGPARRSWSTWSTGWTRSPHSLEGKELNRPVPAGVWAPSTHRWRGLQPNRPPWAYSSPPASGCPLRPAGKRPRGRCAAKWERTGSTRPAASRTGPCASRRRRSSSVGWPVVWTEGSWCEGWSSLPHEHTTPPDSDCLRDRTRCPYICPTDLEKNTPVSPRENSA